MIAAHRFEISPQPPAIDVAGQDLASSSTTWTALPDLGETTLSAADSRRELDYMHARFRSPHTSRFLSTDPVLGNPKLPQSWNRFAYVAGNPLRYSDPTGRVKLAATAEIDVVAGPGGEVGVGIILFDSEDPLGGLGPYTTAGIAGGGNVGAAAGITLAVREIEGEAMNLDVNAGGGSLTLSADDAGFNGLSLTVGPGSGASSSFTTSSSFTARDLANRAMKFGASLRDGMNSIDLLFGRASQSETNEHSEGPSPGAPPLPFGVDRRLNADR